MPTANGNLSAVLDAPRTISLRALPMPQPGEGEVLIEVRAVGVCGSDVHYYEHGRIGEFVVEAPLVLGHELAGVVVGRGPGARLDDGTLVAVEPGVPCRRCPACRAGRYNLCPDVRFLATPPVNGAFTRYLTAPEDFCYPVPNSLSEDAAALIEPLSVGIWACRKAAVRPGERVLVTGAGPIGLLAALVARASGAAPTICDINAERLARAAEFGIPGMLGTPTGPENSPGAGFEVLLECSGAVEATMAGVRLLGPAGRAVLVGMSDADELRLPLSALQTRELTVSGSFRYANTYPAALSLAASGAIPLADLVDATYPLDDVEAALQAARRDPTVLKPVVHPQRRGQAAADPDRKV